MATRMKLMHTQAALEHGVEWMDLKALEEYASMSERTIREWINLPEHALPAVQVGKGKILVKRSQFDRWLEAHPYRAMAAMDIGSIVDEVVADLERAS